jgi:hypothetical protein
MAVAIEKRKRSSRATRETTWQEFAANLESLFAGSKCSFLTLDEAVNVSPATKVDECKVIRLAPGARCILLAVLDPHSKQPVGWIKLDLGRQYDAQDKKLAHRFARVFNHDLEIVANQDSPELWATLQQTRFSRVIARFTNFSTESFLSWLRAVENAINLTYEGQPFSSHLLLTWQSDYVKQPAGRNFTGFERPIEREIGLLGEKWVRALTHSGTVALVAGKRKGIIGILAIDGASIARKSNLPVLHESLSYLSTFLIPGVALITATAVGDLYVFLDSGVIFVKRQGRWRYINFQALLNKIEAHLPSAAAAAVASIVFSLSYEKRGALVAITDAADIAKFVPDHSSGDQPNRQLRDLAKHLDISISAHKKILHSIATIDGAVVFSRNGTVLDVACMIASSSVENTSKPNLLKGVLPGAR